jgi:galactonate dehydratase
METITSVRPIQIQATQRSVWTFVEVVTSEGRVGTGEASLFYGHSEILSHLDCLAGLLRGREPDTGAALLPTPVAADLPQVAAVCALDQALFDLEGQRLGRSIADLMGETLQGEIPVYANINRRTSDRTPIGFAASAGAAVKAGIGAVKIAPFDRVRPQMTRSEAAPRLSVAFDRIAAVRREIGPDRLLMVDCHWRLNASMIDDVIGVARENDLFWIETPFQELPEWFDSIRRLRARANSVGVRIAGAELMVGLAGFQPVFNAELYDVVMPDMTFVGGYEAFLRVAEAAAAKGIWVSPHSPTGPICHAHSVQVSAVVPKFLHMEMQFDETPLFKDIVTGLLPLPIAGSIPVPQANGLGLRLNAACADVASRQNTG